MRIDVLESLRWIPLDLATALAALAALRPVRFGILALPVAAALPLAVAHTVPLFVDPLTIAELNSWAPLVSATMLLAAGYLVDRCTGDGEDYARWVYLPALVFREVANFPVLLATFGLSVIVVTVWLQRPVSGARPGGGGAAGAARRGAPRAGTPAGRHPLKHPREAPRRG